MVLENWTIMSDHASFTYAMAPYSVRNLDRKLRNAAENRFNHSAYLELRRIRCECDNGVLTLVGQVSSHYLRQVAQATMRGIDEIRAIDNQLDVIPYGASHAGWSSE
jgi:osmotically-inducible protein OsmY